MKHSIPYAICIFAFSGIASGGGAHVKYNISGLESRDFQGDPDNLMILIQSNPGTSLSITQISWDINLTTLGVSWAEEASFRIFGDPLGNEIEAIPGFGDAFSVTDLNYAGSSQFTNLRFNSDGQLFLEFYERGFDDNVNAADAIYELGSTLSFGLSFIGDISFTVIPNPGTLGVFGCLLLKGCKRRRRTADCTLNV